MTAIADQTHDELATTLASRVAARRKAWLRLSEMLRDSLADSRRRDEGCNEPMRDRQGFASRQQDRHTGRDEPRHDRPPHRSALLAPAHGEIGRAYRQLMGSDSGNGGRPSGKQIQLDKEIIAARDAAGILALNRRGGARRVQRSQRCDGLQPAGKDAPWLCTWSGPRRSRRATAPLHNQPRRTEHGRAGCCEHNLGAGDARVAGGGGADA